MGLRTTGDCRSILCFSGTFASLLSGEARAEVLTWHKALLLSPTTLAPSFLQALPTSSHGSHSCSGFLCLVSFCVAFIICFALVVLGWMAGTESMEMKWWEPAKLGCLRFGVKCDVHGRARPGSQVLLPTRSKTCILTWVTLRRREYCLMGSGASLWSEP